SWARNLFVGRDGEGLLRKTGFRLTIVRSRVFFTQLARARCLMWADRFMEIEPWSSRRSVAPLRSFQRVCQQEMVQGLLHLSRFSRVAMSVNPRNRILGIVGRDPGARI